MKTNNKGDRVVKLRKKLQKVGGGVSTALLAAGLSALLPSFAVADAYTVPAGTVETVTSQNVGTYNAYDSITVPATAGLNFTGPGTTSFTAPLVINQNGTNIVDSGADVALGSQCIKVGGYMRIMNAKFRAAEPAAVENSTETKTIQVGLSSVHGARVDIEAGAVVTNRLRLGYSYWGGTVVQRGGDVVVYSSTGDTSSHNNHSAIGHGFYKLVDGTLGLVDNFTIGNTFTGPGVFAMHGGSLSHSYTASSEVYINMATGTRPALYYQTGGTSSVNRVNVNRSTGQCVIALTGDETVLNTKSITCGYNYAPLAPAVLSVADGACLTTAKINLYFENDLGKYQGSLIAIANFNGGILRPYASWCNLDGSTANKLGLLRFVVHDGGMTFDMQTYTGSCFYSPLRRATGNGVKTISWNKTTTFNVAPVVLVEETGGGTGWGASAVAEWDPDTKTVTDIKILSPGCDYTAATAYFVYGDTKKDALETTIGPNAGTGDFTVKGTGTGNGILHLYATNTWGGATAIEYGVLQCHNDFAVPEDTALKLKGGKLDLANFKATFRSIGGTAGSIQRSPTNAYEVASLDNDTAATLDLSAFSLSVTGRWDVAAADLIDGKHPVYTADVAFGETATVSVDDLAALEAAGISKVTILETSSALTGVPTLAGPAGNWELTANGKFLRLSRRRGFVISFR